MSHVHEQGKEAAAGRALEPPHAAPPPPPSAHGHGTAAPLPGEAAGPGGGGGGGPVAAARRSAARVAAADPTARAAAAARPFAVPLGHRGSHPPADGGDGADAIEQIDDPEPASLDPIELSDDDDFEALAQGHGPRGGAQEDDPIVLSEGE